MMILIESVSELISITSDIDLRPLLQGSHLANAFIPGFKILRSDSRNSDINIVPQLSIIHKQSVHQNIYVNFYQDEFLIFDDWEKGVPVYIYHFLYSLIHFRFLKKGLISFHSSCISRNNKNLLFIGYSGSGKSSIALELILRKSSLFVSNNKTVINIENNHLKVIGRTLAVTLRDFSDQSRFTKLIANSGRKFLDRNIFFLKENYVDYSYSHNSTVFVRPRINSGVEEFHEINPQEALFLLFPFAVESINKEVILFFGSQTLPDHLNQVSYEVKQGILKVLTQMLLRTKIYHLSGSMEFISEKASEILDS